MPSEFELIARHFTRRTPGARLGVGDDAALLAPSPGMDLAVTTDMLLAGRHFLPADDPQRLGHKALAVNLSDLAAMGARPRWALLALALPEADEAWLAAFSRGFFALAERHGVELVGGDTTRGPLTLSVTLLGEVERERALTRDGARPGDEIWVSGDLGGAALGLAHMQGELKLTPAEVASCLERLHTPEPRLALGRLLQGVASACIDVSDGLLADLDHVLERSRVAAEVQFQRLPAHPAVAARLSDPLVQRCLLAGGDDYELCFTAPPHRAGDVAAAGRAAKVAVTRIGRILAGSGLTLFGADGLPMPIVARGYDHFA
jgi:thiamine-monophosphate kinase